MKKIISAILTVFIISTSCVFASDNLVATNAYTSNVISAHGEITETGDGYIVVKTDEMGEYQFNYDDATYVISAENALPTEISARKSDEVTVYFDSVSTRSIPPQSYAFAIIANASEENGQPIYTVVEKVESQNGGIAITTEGGSKIINVLKDASVTPYLTKNIVKLSDIKEGSELLLYYDAVTLSLPAYAASEKAIILSDGNFVRVNGVKITLSEDEKVYENNGEKLYPLRTVAEALGCTVSWDNDVKAAKVSKDDFSETVYTNQNARAAKANGVIYGNKTYVSETFFDAIR